MNVSALDFKLGLRMLRRYPGITAMATVAMAVAIALGMLYFGGVDQILHPGLAVVTGERLWRPRFARDPSVIGQSVAIGTATETNVALLPHSFRFPVPQRL